MLVTAAAVGLAVWKLLPQTSGFASLDRAVFEFAVKGFANPPFFVSGNGSHEQPWSLRTLSSQASAAGKESLPVISVGDDPDGVFQSSPPQAVDYAVMLRNLKRLGVKRVALADEMAWDDTDPIALQALDARLADFDSAVTCAALTRSSVAEPLPLPFFVASIPLSQVWGDVGLLAQVNRVALPGTFLGSGKTLAGFSLIESEPGDTPLLARWKDRVVFALPVVAALAEAGGKAEQIEVRLGSYLKLGPSGPVVPIDAAGRPAIPSVKFETRSIPAAALIDATSLESAGSVLLRNDRSAAEPGVKTFSDKVANALASISNETGLSKPRVFARLSAPSESALLLGLSALLFFCTTNSRFRMGLAFMTVTVFILIAQISGLAWFSVWLPLYSTLAAVAAGYLVGWPLKSTAPVEKPLKVLDPIDAPEEKTPSPATKSDRKAEKKAAKTNAPIEPHPEPTKPVSKVAKNPAPAKKAARKGAKKGPKPPRSK